MSTCCISTCKNEVKIQKKNGKESYRNEELTYHHFPKDEERRQIWIKNVNKPQWYPSSKSVICSKHFTSNCFYRTNKNRRLHAFAIPTIFTQDANLGKTTFGLSEISNDEIEREFEDCSANIVQVNEYMKLLQQKYPEKFACKDNSNCTTLKSIKNQLKKNYNSEIDIRNKLKIQQQLIRRKTRKINELKRENLSYKRQILDVEKLLTVIPTAIYKKQEFKPELKMFSLVLHGISAEAYEFVRKSFDFALPSVEKLEEERRDLV